MQRMVAVLFAVSVIAMVGCDASTTLPDAAVPSPDLGTVADAGPPDLMIPRGCHNGLRDGKETDTDCGGGCPTACSDGLRCASDSDCASRKCLGGVCVGTLCQTLGLPGPPLIPTPAPPRAIAMGDLDGDGRPDLATVSRLGLSVMLNQGHGSFAAHADYTFGSSDTPSGVAMGDFNGDGLADLVVTSAFDGGVTVFPNQGNGTFGHSKSFATGSYPLSVAVADLDGNGTLDLAVAAINQMVVSVLFNKGDGTFPARVDYPTGFAPTAVAIGDVNGDGAPDLAVANNAGTVSVLINTGKGVFGKKTDYPTGDKPRAVAVGDLDGDGFADLVVANTGELLNDGSTISVLIGSAQGTFAPKVDYPTGPGPAAVAIGDRNDDGKPDLTVANGGLLGHTVTVLLNKGQGSFAPGVDFPAGDAPCALALGDLDGDGRTDLAAGSCQDGAVAVVLGGKKGDALLVARDEYATGNGPESLAVGDLNGDGRTDLIVANRDGASISLFLGRGGGAFSPAVEHPLAQEPRAIAVADLDGDGHEDIAINYNRNLAVLLNQGDGTFAAEVDYSGDGFSVSIGDIDGDGRPELVTPFGILFNQGAGKFAPQLRYATGMYPESAALGDLDGDGKLDIAIADNGQGTVNVLLNRGQGTFAPRVDYPAGDGPWAVAIGDLDGDQKADLVVTDNNYDNKNAVLIFLNRGQGTLAPAVDYPVSGEAWSVALADLNGDGRLDVALAGSPRQGMAVFLNQGGGSLIRRGDYSAYNDQFVVAGDFDGDGKLDLAGTEFYADRLGVFLNRCR